MAAGAGEDVAKLQREVKQLDDRYKLTQILGAGSYGVVAKAGDEKDMVDIAGVSKPRGCAVKKISAMIFQDVRSAKRILREVKVLAHFHEQNIGADKAQYIIGLRNLITPPSPDFDNFWIIMELAETDMKAVLSLLRKQRQKLSIAQVQYMLYEMLHGLNTMKACKVIHRDIHPANILVNLDDLAVKICDFGLAREEPKEDDPYMTEYVTMRWYRAPELLMESKTYTEQVDIWGIACIFGEMLGWGMQMFRGFDRINQLDKIVEICGSPDREVLARIGSKRAQRYVARRYVGPTCEKGEKQRFVWHDRPEYQRHVKVADGMAALDLLDKMLVFDPSQRITVEEALEHAFIRKYSKDPKNVRSLDVSQCPKFLFSDDHLPDGEEGLKMVKKELYEACIQFHKANPDTMTLRESLWLQEGGGAIEPAGAAVQARTGFEGTATAGEARVADDTDFDQHGSELPGEVDAVLDAISELASGGSLRLPAYTVDQLVRQVPDCHAELLKPAMVQYGWDGKKFSPELDVFKAQALVRRIRESFQSEKP